MIANTHPLLAHDKVRYVGDRVAAVVASTIPAPPVPGPT